MEFLGGTLLAEVIFMLLFGMNVGLSLDNVFILSRRMGSWVKK